MKKNILLNLSDCGTAAYLSLPSHPGEPGDWKMSKTVQLIDLLGPYGGPEILLDFGPDGNLAGIEILLDDDEDEGEED